MIYTNVAIKLVCYKLKQPKPKDSTAQGKFSKKILNKNIKNIDTSSTDLEHKNYNSTSTKQPAEDAYR